MSRIIKQDYPGQIRAVALDDVDRAFSLFEWRDPLLDPRPKWGQVYSGIVSKHASDIGGVFVRLQGIDAPILCQIPKTTRLPNEGEHVRVKIKSENWAEKSTIGKLTDEPVSSTTHNESFDAWRSSILDLGHKLSDQYDDQSASIVSETFDDCRADTLVLPEGGQIHFQTVRAFTAIDFDTSGKKLAADRMAFNLAGIVEVARQSSLKRLGGVVIVDLVGVVNEVQHKELTTTFRSEFRRWDNRPVQVLARNAFGLFEFSVPRQSRSYLLSSDVDPLHAGFEALASFWRFAAIELSANRVETVSFAVGSKLLNAIKISEFDGEKALAEQYGARFHISEDDARNDWSYDIKHVE